MIPRPKILCVSEPDAQAVSTTRSATVSGIATHPAGNQGAHKQGFGQQANGDFPLAQASSLKSSLDNSGNPACDAAKIASLLREECDVVEVYNPMRALARLGQDQFAGLFVSAKHFGHALKLGQLLQNERILEGMPDGVVLLNAANTIYWANDRFRRWSASVLKGTNHNQDQASVGSPSLGSPSLGEPVAERPVFGSSFYAALGNPEIIGPDFCPFHTALATGEPSVTTLRLADNRYFQVHAAAIHEIDGQVEDLIVTVRDITVEVLQQQKLAAIHQAGIELADLSPSEVGEMTVEDRIDLLKSNILHHTKALLHFDVIEIRLLDQKTGRLEPLLSVGLKQESAVRPLYAKSTGNGVTGFVAATGKSYLCEDTTVDPLYIEGAQGAKSSLTVPLALHEQVIGTFNVESPEPRGFSESDLQFLEIYCRDLAVALNTLELLVAQQANTLYESCDAIHSAVALPIDDILNDAVNIMERYIGHEPEVVLRLKSILRNARDIKQVIQKVGQEMAPATAAPPGMLTDQFPKLRHCRVLVVDADEKVRNDAHAQLERYGCIVETARTGGEATYMVLNPGLQGGYDAIIADIRLPDLCGYDLFCRLKEIVEQPPLILMAGYGYDPTHSIPKSRQAGLHPQAVLCKPFRLDLLLQTVELIASLNAKAIADRAAAQPAPPLPANGSVQTHHSQTHHGEPRPASALPGETSASA